MPSFRDTTGRKIHKCTSVDTVSPHQIFSVQIDSSNKPPTHLRLTRLSYHSFDTHPLYSLSSASVTPLLSLTGSRPSASSFASEGQIWPHPSSGFDLELLLPLEAEKRILLLTILRHQEDLNWP